MNELQLVNQQAAAQGPTSPPRSSLSSESPTRSPSKVGIASLPPDKSATAGQDVVMPKAEVLDWVAKAKESIEAFGEYIGIGTASATKNLIGDSDDSLDSDSDDDNRFLSARGSEDEGEEASVVSEDRELSSRHVSPETRGRRDAIPFSERPATIPSHVAPFGLMANLLRKSRQDDDQGGGDAEKPGVGVAGRDYFRAGTSIELPQSSQMINFGFPFPQPPRIPQRAWQT